jgi:ABC-2 type transport system permease protein
MNFYRIYAIILRHIYIVPHNLNKVADLFYWPTLDLLLWGITSLFIKSLEPGLGSFVVMIVAGIIFWQIIWRGQIEITVNVLEEFWNQNLINLFITPLKFREWIAALMTIGFAKTLLELIFSMSLAFFLYQVNILQYGLKLIPFIALLLMSGWWIGMLVGSLILRFGTKLENLAWSVASAFSPFSAVYYPVTILPLWAQKIAWCLPTTYVFEGMRKVINQGTVDKNYLMISLGLNIFYLVIAIAVMNYNFRKALKNGLVKV